MTFSLWVRLWYSRICAEKRR